MRGGGQGRAQFVDEITRTGPTHPFQRLDDALTRGDGQGEEFRDGGGLGQHPGLVTVDGLAQAPIVEDMTCEPPLMTRTSVTMGENPR